MGRTCVYVHHVDKDAFLKGNIDPDPDELDMVFDLCPSYGELLEHVRKDLNWMDPSDVVEFDGRHNVGFGMHILWKTMHVNSEQRWLAYKDTVAESLDKALELFDIKTNVPNLLDLNRVASSIVEAIPAPINEEANIEPLSCVDEANEEVNIEHEPLVEANTMDHSIPYARGYASESDDEGPDEEVDEEGFTAKEAEAFKKVWPLLNPTRQNRSGGGGKKDATSEEQRLMERAAKKLREEDAAEARKKKDEEHKVKMDEEWQMFLERQRYEARIKENDRKTLEKRKKEYEANFKKMWAEGAAKRERKHQRFTERVKEEALKMRKREEEEEEERKKKKGKGPCSTQ
ncbi:hypothetical protein D1007_03990 [Hordeum vulgare]|nr:hypothetical protein D1007_03990 [Hordeum vulgare]